MLRSAEPELGETDFLNARFAGGDDSFDILELRAASELRESPELPRSLAQPEGARNVAAEPDRRFELGARDINGLQMDLGRVDHLVEPGTTEIWELENTAGIPHNFHPHAISFKIVEYDGAPPPPPLAGFKDTIFVPPA